jgi:hypothetical protein
MFEHDMPEFLPASLGIGDKYKVTLKIRPREVTSLFTKERIGDDRAAETADRWFLATLRALYGKAPFLRGNLDAGRLNRLYGREIVPAQDAGFDAESLEAELAIDVDAAGEYFKHVGDGEVCRTCA